MDQFGDTILFTTDDDILEAMSRYDETFLSEGEGPEGLVQEEEFQRPRTADGEGEERPFTQAGFREEDLTVSTGLKCSPNLLCQHTPTTCVYVLSQLKIHLNPTVSRSEDHIEHVPGMYAGKSE